VACGALYPIHPRLIDAVRRSPRNLIRINSASGSHLETRELKNLGAPGLASETWAGSNPTLSDQFENEQAEKATFQHHRSPYCEPTSKGAQKCLSEHVTSART
jgi:hypothetical protein